VYWDGVRGIGNGALRLSMKPPQPMSALPSSWSLTFLGTLRLSMKPPIKAGEHKTFSCPPERSVLQAVLRRTVRLILFLGVVMER